MRLSASLDKVHERRPRLSPALAVLAAGGGGGRAIFVLATLHARTSLAMLAPSFGATCALVTLAILGSSPLALATGVRLAIAGMMVTRRCTRPPPAIC